MAWTTQDMPDQSGRTIVVTGGNGGLGLEVARAFAARGARVIIASRDEEKLSAITRKKGKEEFELTLSGINWELTKPVKQKADAETLQNLAGDLGRLRAVRVAAFDPKDLEKPFGLKDPAAVFTFKLGDTETKTLRIGSPVDAAKPDGDRYALADGPGPRTVGVLPGSLIQHLLAERNGVLHVLDAEVATNLSARAGCNDEVQPILAGLAHR